MNNKNTDLKISVCQMNSTIGDFESNIKQILKACHNANSIESNIIVFPELVISGYYPGDLINDKDFLNRNKIALDKIIHESNSFKHLTVILGSITEFIGIGKQKHNSAIVIRNGEIITEYHKQLLPTYNIFDELRHFEPGPNENCIIEVLGYRISILICEDVWNDSGTEYKINPFDGLDNSEVDLIISLNASPSNLGKYKQRHDTMSKICTKYEIPLLYVNCYGGQDSIVFDGSSFAMNTLGKVEYESGMFVYALDQLSFSNKGFKQLNKKNLSKYASENKDEFSYQQIKLGLKDYVEKCGFTKVIVGSSGGIDSALTIALAVDALGAENVEAITMPSIFSSAGSTLDSKLLCDNLNVKLYTYKIQAAVDIAVKQFEDSFGTKPSSLTMENIQARERGVGITWQTQSSSRKFRKRK